MEEKYFSQISDDEIIIREIKDADIEDLYELLSNENVCKYLGVNAVNEKGKIYDFISRVNNDYSQKQIFYLGIEFKKNHKIIGYIGLSKYDLTKETCQIIYALNESYWHQGIMVKALKLFVKYLTEVQNKQLIIATHIDENINSGKVMIKAGFSRDKNYDTKMLIKGINQNLIGFTIKNKKGEKL